MTSTICHHTVLNLKSWTTLHWINYSRSLSHMALVNSKTKHFLSCKLTTGMGINFKEKLWNLARPGAGPSPDPQKIPPKKIKIYAIIRSFLWKSTFSSTLPPTGTTSVTSRWKPPHFNFKISNSWSSSQAPANSRVQSSLVSELEVRSCDVWNQDL